MLFYSVVKNSSSSNVGNRHYVLDSGLSYRTISKWLKVLICEFGGIVIVRSIHGPGNVDLDTGKIG